jgi:predicted DNA-binding protein
MGKRMTKPRARDRQTHWRIESALVERLAIDAEQAGRSVAWLVNELISEHYAQRDAPND